MGVTTPARNWTLRSGERIVPHTVTAADSIHRARYEWATQIIGQPPRLQLLGLDAFCGVGYGTYLLAQALGSGLVLGVDGSADAIAHANERYADPHAMYSHRAWPFALPSERFDFITCFESVEHVEDGPAFMEALARSLVIGGMLLLSTPNEQMLPHATFANPFHVRHFTWADIVDMCMRAGLSLVEWHGQKVPGALGMVREQQGQFNVFAFRKFRRSS